MIDLEQRATPSALARIVYPPAELGDLIHERMRIVRNTLPLLREEFIAPNKLVYTVVPSFAPGWNTLGSTTWEDYAQTRLITYVNLGGPAIAETLFHEFTHGDQLFSHRLAMDDNGIYWEGAPADYVDPGGKINVSRAEFARYEASPWEVEARANASRLIAKHQIAPNGLPSTPAPFA